MVNMIHYKILYVENSRAIISYSGPLPPAAIDIKMCRFYYAVDVCGDRVHLLVRYGHEEIKDPHTVAGRAWEMLSPDSDRNCRHDYISTETEPDKPPSQQPLFPE